MSRKFKWFIIVMAIFLMIGSSFSYVNASDKNQITLILINQLSYTDYSIYQDISGFKLLEENGARGFMNINSGGSRSAANSYLSIGSGTKANGIKDMGDSFMADELIAGGKSANQLYLQQTGREIASKEAIIFLSIEKLKKAEQKYPIKVGALGELLKANNLSSSVYGNNDIDKRIRYAPLITMDETGLSYGDVGATTLQNDELRPFGIKTDYDMLLTNWEKDLNNGTSLVVIDLGDLSRLAELNDQMSKEYGQIVKTEIYKEMGDFISKIINKLDKNQTLIVASPMVNNEGIKSSNLLAPIWIYGDNIEGNILTSNTTKREGIVVNIDITATIIDLLHIKEQPIEMIGEKIEIINSGIDLDKELYHIASIYSLRPQVVYSYVFWQIIVLLFSVWVWLKKKTEYMNFTKIILAGILSYPLLLLLTAIYTPSNLYIYLFFLLIISMIIGWLLSRLKPAKMFFAIGLLTFLALTIDILLDSFLIKRSFLGYDPIIGARFYGIGNEYMGIYIGATLLFTSSLLQLSKKNNLIILLVSTIYFILCFFLLYPTLGTNAGGSISAIFAVTFTLLNMIGLSKRRSWFILLLSGVILGFIALIAINYFVAQENQSHIGRAINQIKIGNISAIFQTIERKLNMNWRLIQVTSWSKVMLTSLFVMAILFIKNSFLNLKNKYTYIFYGFYGIILGAIIALIVNDSGVIAASTMIIYVAVPMLYLSLIEKELNN